MFVPAGKELAEQVRCVGFKGQVADLVDDDQRVAARFDHFAGKITALVGLGQSGDPVCGAQEAVSAVSGGDAEGSGEVGFTDAW